MNLKRLAGLDILSEKYAYGHDAQYGYVAESRVADHWVPTTCGYCSVGCGMLVGVKDGRAVAARGDERHPVNRGKLCPKGLSEHHTLSAHGRAQYPLLRKNGKLERIGWDEALAVMVERIGGIQARHGAGAFGVISTGQLVTEEFYALGKLVQLGFGTSNYDGNTTLCMSSAVAGYKRSFGSDGPPGSYDDLAKADVILLIGANIAENHPILCQRLLENPGATLIVADPRVTKTAMMADIFLPVKPRSDIALLNGIAHILIRDGWIDQDYIARHTTGFEELRAHLAAYTPARVRRIDRPRCTPDRTGRHAVRPRQGRLHRLDDGREPLHARRRDRQRHQQSGAVDREHRARRRGAVLHHRTMQRHGHARGGLRLRTSRLSQVRIRRRSRGTGRALEHRPGAHSPDTRPGLSRHHRGGRRQARPRPVDHRHQSDGLLPQSRRPEAGAGDGGVPGGAGRFPSHAHQRTRAPGAAGRDVGRKGRHLHQLRTARQQSESRRCAAGRSAAGLRHLSRSRRTPGRARRTLPRLAGAARRLRRMEARVGRPPVRLQRHDLGRNRSPRRHAMGRRAPVCRWRVPHARRPREAVRHRVGAVPGPARAALPLHSEYRPHRRALAHRDQDPRRADSGRHVAARLAGDESARRPAPASEAARPRERDLEAQPRRPGGTARHRNRRAGAGIHALPFRGNEFEPRHPERLRPDLPRTEFQAVRRKRREKPGDRRNVFRFLTKES